MSSLDFVLLLPDQLLFYNKRIKRKKNTNIIYFSWYLWAWLYSLEIVLQELWDKHKHKHVYCCIKQAVVAIKESQKIRSSWPRS